MNTRIGNSNLVLSLMIASGLWSGCGEAIPLYNQGLIGAAVEGGNGGSRVDGSDLSIYPVNQVIVATAANPYPTLAELPFLGQQPGVVSAQSTGAVTIGHPCTDGQTYFYYQYAYPPNNYKLSEAHLVLDVKRDPSDTEGIFVAGAFSGAPPLSFVNTGSPHVQYPLYLGYTGPTGSWYTGPAPYTPNTYYNDWAISHYKIGALNTFDLNIDSLLNYTNVRTADVIQPGKLPVVAGDDSEVDQAILVLNGITISATPLNCTSSPSFTFTNDYVHTDGNSIGASAFSGPVLSPISSWTSAPAAFQSVEWFYDEALPRVPVANVNLTNGTLTLTVKRNTSGTAQAAIVVNGYGIAAPGFNQALGNTLEIQSWDSGSATTYWKNWVAAIPATNTATAVTLDLIAMLGADQLKSLLAQGKFNVALAGSLAFVSASAASSARVKGSPVSGPELNLKGNYFTQVCDVPNDPSSPLNDNAPAPTNLGPHSSPIVSSLSATQITSSSAVIQWLTNTAATSQVAYGVGNTSTTTPNNSALVTFHSVQISGLQPYRVYEYNVITDDSFGDQTISPTLTFQTLR